MAKKRSLKFLVILVVLLAAGGGYYLWRQAGRLPAGFASGNGRIEATEVDVAAKHQGRVEAVLVKEGDMVKEGQLLAQMDAAVLRAQLAEAEAAAQRAQADREVAAATATQRRNEHELAMRERDRAQQLARQSVIEKSRLDTYVTAEQTARAQFDAAKAQVASAEAAIQSAAATIDKFKAEIADTMLTTPRGGRVEYKLVEPGEVIPAGGKVVTLLDLLDVFMTFFLPTDEAGKVLIGADARIVLDALPESPIPAKVSFVSPTAQFTPKEVETRSEREKLMFRIKVRIDPELLRPHVHRVRSGLPGVGYVRLDPSAQWPENLKTREERGLPPLIPPPSTTAK